MKNFLLKLSLVVLLVISGLPSYAQPAGGSPPGGPSGGSNPPCWPPPCIPVDGGISILIALGAAYGSKKAYDFYKSNDQSED